MYSHIVCDVILIFVVYIVHVCVFVVFYFCLIFCIFILTHQTKCSNNLTMCSYMMRLPNLWQQHTLHELIHFALMFSIHGGLHGGWIYSCYIRYSNIVPMTGSQRQKSCVTITHIYVISCKTFDDNFSK